MQVRITSGWSGLSSLQRQLGVGQERRKELEMRLYVVCMAIGGSILLDYFGTRP